MAPYQQAELTSKSKKTNAEDNGQESNTPEPKTDSETSTSNLSRAEFTESPTSKDTCSDTSCQLDVGPDNGLSENRENRLTLPRETTRQEEDDTSTKPILSLYEKSPGSHSQISPPTLGNSDSLDSGHFSHSSSKDKPFLAARDINKDLNLNSENRGYLQPRKGVKTFTITHLLGESSHNAGTENTCTAPKHAALSDTIVQAQHGGSDASFTDNPREILIQKVLKSERKRCRSGSSDRCLNPSDIRPSSCDIEDDEEASSASTGTSCPDATFTEREGQGHTRPKRKLKRTQYSKSDLRILNAYFNEDNWLSPIKQEALAKEMGYTDVQIKTWFQNKRASIYGTRRPKGKNRELTTASPHLDDDNKQGFSDQFPQDFKTGSLNSRDIANVTFENSFLPQVHKSAFSSQLNSLITWNPSAICEVPPTSNTADKSHGFQHLYNSELQAYIGLQQLQQPLPGAVPGSHAANQFPNIYINSVPDVTKCVSHTINGTSHVRAREDTIRQNARHLLPSAISQSDINKDVYARIDVPTSQTSQEKPKRPHDILSLDSTASDQNQPLAPPAALTITEDRYGPSYQRIDYTLPENNPFIAAFLNLSEFRWNSPRFSPLIKPHVTPQSSSLLALTVDRRARLA